MNSLIRVDEKFFNEIISMTDLRKANQKMYNALIVILKSDNQMMDFCNTVLSLCCRTKLCKEILDFTTGK